ncbi:MAG: hypothetical protein E5X60_34435, partial [Mesorhizobium sp.]
FLLGHDGDAINALLVAAGQNLRLILTVLALWLAWCLQALQPKTAKSDAATRLHAFGISTPLTVIQGRLASSRVACSPSKRRYPTILRTTAPFFCSTNAWSFFR